MTQCFKFTLLKLIFSLTCLFASESKFWENNEETTPPCKASELVKVVRSGLKKSIPTFNPQSLSIQLQTDDGLVIQATDPELSKFLINYYTLASKTINEMEKKDFQARSAMLLSFTSNYLMFLDNYGVPLACLSYYSGKMSWSSVVGVHDLAERLQKKFGGMKSSNSRESINFAVSGDDILEKLGLDAFSFVAYPQTQPKGSYNPICDVIFLKLQDGSILTNLPSISTTSDAIKIPGEGNTPIYTSSTANVTFLLDRYFSSGINCLDSNYLRANFTSTFCIWMSSKLLPAILSSPSCFSGFQGVLGFLKSSEKYRDQIYNVELPHARKRRDLQSAANIRLGHLTSKDEATVAAHKQAEHQISDAIVANPKYAKDLHHLYEKLEDLFGERNQRVSNLEIVQDGELVAHVTKTAGDSTVAPLQSIIENPVVVNRKRFGGGGGGRGEISFRPKNTDSNSGFGNQRPTQRTFSFTRKSDRNSAAKLVAQEPDRTILSSPVVWFSDNAKLKSANEDDEFDSRSPTFSRVGTELEIDEDNLQNEISMEVHDDKIQAYLDIEPTKPSNIDSVRQVILDAARRSGGRHQGNLKKRKGYKQIRNYILKKRFGPSNKASNAISGGVNYLQSKLTSPNAYATRTNPSPNKEKPQPELGISSENVMNRNEDREQQAVYDNNAYQNRPPNTQFKNLYYDDTFPPPDFGTGEYAPLQGAPPQEIIQNEVYKINPRFTYQLQALQQETTTNSTIDLPMPLAAGVSFAGLLFLLLMLCLFPFLYFQCNKTKKVKRQKKRIQKWVRDHLQLDERERLPSDESSSDPFIATKKDRKKKGSKCKNKTLVNIKVNETPIAEVSITEGENSSSSSNGDDGSPSEGGIVSEGDFLKQKYKHQKQQKRRKKQRRGQEQRESEEQAYPIGETYMKSRKESVPRFNRRKESTEEPKWERRNKRHSLPLPTADDFRPPPLPYRSIQMRKTLEKLRPIQETTVYVAPSEDSVFDQEKHASPTNLIEKSSEDRFYQDHMVRWE